jgi:signal recognition particle subunit SRP54
MVLAELGTKIVKALNNMRNTTVIDETVVDEMLKEIGNALVSSDVQIQLVLNLRKNIKNQIKLSDLAAGLNKRKLIQKVVFDELCNLLDPKTKPFQPKKGHPNIIMFVGLQGAGKTTTVSKMAYYYKRKGWNPCVVCADTFRAGAFDQLKQNATKVKVPFYGSYTETDPVKVAQDGVEQFKKENYDIIIVDTSGRHKQEQALFEEMQQVAEVIKPDNIVFVMDSSIGQAAFDQASAFKKAVPVGSVIITKLDGHAKGGGALSAVAATNSPIIFIGTGEHMDDLELFDTKAFVSKLLGMGDVKELMKVFQEAIPMDKAPELAQRLSEGKFTLRDMYEQLGNIMKMGPLNKVMEMMPGMSNIMPQLKGNDGNQKIKIMMTIMDSMTDDELDSLKPIKEQTRIQRIARGSGRSIKEVNELIEQHKLFSKMVGKMKSLGKGNLMRGGPQQLAKMANMVPPQIMKQMGGVGGLNNLMKQMGDLKIPGFKF